MKPFTPEIEYERPGGETYTVGGAKSLRSFPSKRLTRPAGEWNHYYVRGINGEVRLWVNGEEVNGATEWVCACGDDVRGRSVWISDGWRAASHDAIWSACPGSAQWVWRQLFAVCVGDVGDLTHFGSAADCQSSGL